MHALGGRYKSIGNLIEIAVFEIVTEDKPPRADPTQHEAFGSKVVLEHPVVAAWLRVQRRPHRGHVGHAHWNSTTLEAFIERARACVPQRIELMVTGANFRIVEVFQEFVHRGHHIWM